MLKSWFIQNFKAIVDSGDLQLAPVTILAGRNSSGKSSLIQSILMIAQTLGNQQPDRALLPNGPMAQLRTFEDILSKQTRLRSIVVGFALEWQEGGKCRVTSQFGSASGSSANSAIEAAKVTVENVSLEISLQLPLPNGALFPSKTLLPSAETQGLREFRIDIQKLSSIELDRFLDDVSPGYLRLVPYLDKNLNYLGIFESKNKWDIVTHIPPSSLIDFSHFLPTHLIGKYPWSNDDPEDKKEAKLVVLTNENFFVEWLLTGVKQVTQFFTSKIRYLGPQHANPQSTQQLSQSGELDDVGQKGEYSAIVYHINQSAFIKYYDPSSNEVKENTLKVALNTWVRYLGVAYQVQTYVAALGGVSWQVIHKEGHKPLPLTAVGVGVSQVLPILVMGLLAPTNTLLLIEEPEANLHPTAQARLSDFFMGLAKCDKQCLIETHSENLVSQLRYHIVQAGGQEKSDCLIYFVNQDERGAALFDPVQISPQGNILNWPDGFFDETMLQEDRITAASLKKRTSLDIDALFC